MIWFSTLTRLALCGVAGWFCYQTFCERQIRRKLEREFAHVEQELVQISPPPSSEVMVQIANPSKDFCSWLCYIPEGKHVKIVCVKGDETHETVMDFGVSPIFRKIYLQLSINTTQDTSAKPLQRLTLWGPNASEHFLPMGPGFELVKHDFLVESEKDRKALAEQKDFYTYIKGLALAKNAQSNLSNKDTQKNQRLALAKNRPSKLSHNDLRKNLRSVTCNSESDVVIFRYSIERTVEEKLESLDYCLSVITEDSN